MANSFRSLILACCTNGLLFACGTAAANLVANPGFEAGFGDWGSENSDVFSSAGVDEGAAHSGSFSAYFGNSSATPGTLDQVIATSIGTTYQISYWLQNEDLGGDGATSFTAKFGDTLLTTP